MRKDTTNNLEIRCAPAGGTTDRLGKQHPRLLRISWLHLKCSRLRLFSIGCDIVSGSHPLGGPLTGVVKDDFGRRRLRYAVMCSGHDHVRTCTLGALHNYCMINLVFLLRVNYLGLWSQEYRLGC